MEQALSENLLNDTKQATLAPKIQHPADYSSTENSLPGVHR